MTALISASLSLIVGVLLGAAIQRWGDADRATEHHTKLPPGRLVETRPAGSVEQRWLDESGETRRDAFYVRDWGPIQ